MLYCTVLCSTGLYCTVRRYNFGPLSQGSGVAGHVGLYGSILASHLEFSTKAKAGTVVRPPSLLIHLRFHAWYYAYILLLPAEQYCRLQYCVTPLSPPIYSPTPLREFSKWGGGEKSTRAAVCCFWSIFALFHAVRYSLALCTPAVVSCAWQL